MRLINRKEEITLLRRIEKLAKDRLFIVAIYGIRRVGKTRLALEFGKGRILFFFVNKNKTTPSLLSEYSEILRRKEILRPLEKLENWDQFFSILLERWEGIMIFDEFQNFYSVAPEVFGILQKTADANENKPGLIILTGSLIGLMKKIFRDRKEPLYGRIKQKIKLLPLNFCDSFEMAREINADRERTVEFYAIFGGYPKYYVAIDDFGLKGKPVEEVLDEFFFRKNAVFEDEIVDLLSQEFGSRTGIYYGILEAIANGNGTISEIAGTIRVPVTSITRQLNELKNYFEMIDHVKPYKGKKGRYRITHPLLEFWFVFFYKHSSQYKRRSKEFERYVKENLNAFIGRRFESIAGEFISKKTGLEYAARHWGKIPESKEVYEIDLVGRKGDSLYFFEFKWKNLTKAEAIGVLKGLEKKSEYLRSKKKKRFGLIAKKIGSKKELEKAGYLVYELKDFCE